MALKISSPPPFTVFSPQTPSPRTSKLTEIRFSRWNNANAQKFIEKRRAQQEIEDDIRRERRFTSATKITEIPKTSTSTTTTTTTTNENFRSIGTPSSPSSPSIPGKKSKYSKNPNPDISHPAFSRIFKSPKFSVSKVPNDAPSGVQVGDTGVTYKVPNAPFEFQYSYTETPKVKPLALREPPFVPFGPTTMPRPWTGRAPLPSSKKKLPEFDSFRLPPPHKKGVKPVQSPGPFLKGMGPKYVKSREEILGDPLTEEEIKDLIEGCVKTRRQLNMGRDGLTHNMLDNIHAHWKRRRVCKIKCKGVCTVDMDNVRQQLEEKTGGKIIYSKGGVLFLFRGRNYNYRSRPRFPLMLWKPITPVYPRLIQHAPEGLTLEEATQMRKRGRELPAICKLGKNGVYSGLVGHVREAFEECELARIDCTGMNGSDYKKIGGKLKDLVPCVLVSFEREHILMWRGKDWKSSLANMREPSIDGGNADPPNGSDSSSVDNDDISRLLTPSSSKSSSEAQFSSASATLSTVMDTVESGSVSDNNASGDDQSVISVAVPTVDKCATAHDNLQSTDDESEFTSTSTLRESSVEINPPTDGVASHDLQTSSEESQHVAEISRKSMKCIQGVVLLQKKAIESGSALLLDDASLDADIIYRKSVAFAKDAPSGPVYRNSVRKVLVRKHVKKENSDVDDKEIITVTQKTIENKSFRNQRLKDFKDVDPDTLPYGSLGVDELAKLLG